MSEAGEALLRELQEELLRKDEDMENEENQLEENVATLEELANDDQRAQPSPVSRTGEKRDSSSDGAPPSKRSVAGFNPVLSPELLATLPKKEIVAQLRAHGLAAPVRCTVADLRQRLLAYLARH